MKITSNVRKILGNYDCLTPGVKSNLARILMNGVVGGSGKVVILAVDQGFEHGPDRSFMANNDAYDPFYHYKSAVDFGLSAYAAPLGALEVGADFFAGQMPTILKINSGNSLYGANNPADQALTAGVKDAVRLGCAAIGFTIYPGSDKSLEMFQEIKEIIQQAREYGLAVVIWSYPRGAGISKDGETAIDVVSYGAHMACLLGADIAKVKIPSDFVEQKNLKDMYTSNKIDFKNLPDRISHVVKCCFNGRRMVIFSGGESKNLEALYAEIEGIKNGGGFGSIIGRNAFQRPLAHTMTMWKNIAHIYKSKN